jgi:hypothetical protein
LYVKKYPLSQISIYKPKAFSHPVIASTWKVRACTPKCLAVRRSGVPARSRGNLIVKGEIASVPSQ